MEAKADGEQAQFGDFHFEYHEVVSTSISDPVLMLMSDQPCPQQKDASSCGLMVVRNAMQRMNGQAVGRRDVCLNPERIRKDIIDLLEAGCASGRLIPGPALRKSHRVPRMTRH